MSLVSAVLSLAAAVGLSAMTIVPRSGTETIRATEMSVAVVFFFGGGWENGTIQAFVRQADHLARRGMVAAR